jgi:tetratricopeptide (TPR) repeat protein
VKEIIKQAQRLGEQSFDSEVARAEAFEALREQVDDDEHEDEVLFDLAFIEAQSHSAHRAQKPVAGESADVLLTAWARVVGGAPVDSRVKEFTIAMDALSEALGDRTLDGTPEVAANAWMALARAALRSEAMAAIRKAIACANRALAGVHGACSGEAALLLLELASHADDAETAREASERLWSLRAEPALDVNDRFQFVAPVWQVRMALGDADGARAAADALLALANESQNRGRNVDALGAVAECAMAQGDVRAARIALAERIALTEVLLAEARDDAARSFALARRDEAHAAMALLEEVAIEADEPKRA